MKKAKKTVSLILTAVMLLSILITAPTTASAAITDITETGYSIPDETGFVEKLNQLRAKYPNGGTWSDTYYEDGEPKAYQCFGYANQMLYEVFGAKFYNDGFCNKKDYNMGTIYAGDWVRIVTYGEPNNHSIFITKVTSDRVYFTDANWDTKNGIRWDASYTKAELAQKFSYKVHIPGNTLTGNGSAPTSRVTFDTSSLSDVTTNNAKISTWVSNNGTISETGVYIGTNTMEKIKTNSPNAQWTRFELKYNLNDIYGILTPGQKYNYQFYVISNGEEFKSLVATFTTKGDAYISFDTYGLESISETAAKPTVWFSNNNVLNISEIGFSYGINRKDLTNKKIIGGVYWTRSHLKYELNGLAPNVNYYVRYYIIVNGVTHYSDFINFTTKSKITFDTYSINGTKPKTVKCGVWFSNKDGYTLNEIGFLIGKDESSLEKVKIKENVGWTRSHLLYTLSDYYMSIEFDTNYCLKYYIVIDDIIYYSNFIKFRTGRDVTFDTYAQGIITNDSFPVSVWMSNEDGNNLDSIGFMYGENLDELKIVEVTKNVRWTRSNLSYDIKKYIPELTSGLYYYCFYVKVGNNTYLSNINNAKYSAPTEKPTDQTTESTQSTTVKPTEPTSTEPTQPTTVIPTETTSTETTEPTTVKPTETTEPTQPTTAKPTEPIETQPTTVEPTEPTEPTPATEEKTDISKWQVSGIYSKQYTGKYIKQDGIVVYNDGEYADVKVKYRNNLNAGTATVIITGTGDYTGTITETFKINKAENPMLTWRDIETVSSKALKKRKVIVKGAIGAYDYQGSVTFTKLSGSKSLTISKGGVITVKKGKYKKNSILSMKVKVTAKGNANYMSKSRKMTVKIKIK
ncbi:MAG: hypothetical protein ACI4RM_00030 [Ruminococcus sp.]